MKSLNLEQTLELLEQVALIPDAREKERIELLVGHCLHDPTFLAVPPDPFSPAYAAHVHTCWSALTGRAEYAADLFEIRPIDIEQMVRKPDAYSSDGGHLGQFLEAYGQIISLMEVRPGDRVLEFGPGDGQIALHLARLGCDVTVVDIEPGFLRVIEEQARRLGVSVRTVHGDFLNFGGHAPFDRIFYFESFHHSLQHQQVLAKLHPFLKADGRIVFSGEPVIDPDDPTAHWNGVVPYPWGIRLDGLSVRAMKMHGWMELGFQQSYFVHALMRAGWMVRKKGSATTGIASSFIAQKFEGYFSLEQPWMLETCGMQAGWHRIEDFGRWSAPEAHIALPDVAADVEVHVRNPLKEQISVVLESAGFSLREVLRPQERRRMTLRGAATLLTLRSGGTVQMSKYFRGDTRQVGVFVEGFRRTLRD